MLRGWAKGLQGEQRPEEAARVALFIIMQFFFLFFGAEAGTGDECFFFVFFNFSLVKDRATKARADGWEKLIVVGFRGGQAIGHGASNDLRTPPPLKGYCGMTTDFFSSWRCAKVTAW